MKPAPIKQQKSHRGVKCPNCGGLGKCRSRQETNSQHAYIYYVCTDTEKCGISWRVSAMFDGILAQEKKPIKPRLKILLEAETNTS